MTAVRIEGEPMRAGAFVVPSKSQPGTFHTVIWVTEGVAWCPCIGFGHRSTCSHLADVALAIEIETRQSLERATATSRAEAAEKMAVLAEVFNR